MTKYLSKEPFTQGVSGIHHEEQDSWDQTFPPRKKMVCPVCDSSNFSWSPDGWACSKCGADVEEVEI